MSRETVAEKARRYLVEGRVIVTTAGPDHVAATVRGDGHLYHCGFARGHWHCTCAAGRDCSHRRALRLVTAPDLDRYPTTQEHR
jgi:hypothetical protein